MIFNHQIGYTAAPATSAAASVEAPGRTSSGGGRSVSRLLPLAADVGRDTLRSAADATWQPEMNYGRSRVPTATRCCTCWFCIVRFPRFHRHWLTLQCKPMWLFSLCILISRRCSPCFCYFSVVTCFNAIFPVKASIYREEKT